MHFDPVNDGEDTNILREKFMDYLKEKNIIVDEIFFTGDFRHALHQMGQSDEETAKNACEFLENIAQCSLKSNNDIYSHLHIVPGNHDLSRGNGELLDKIYEKYDPDKANFKEIIENEQTGLDILLSRFDFFQRCAEILKNDIWTCMLNGQVCHVKEIEECNIIYINTAIASGRKMDRGNLYVGRQYIANAFRQAVERSPKKPIIVLAHNIINDIEKNEQLKIKNFINDLEIPVVWLCGDSHDTEYNNSYNTAYITAGCLIQERGTEASFFVGNLDEDGLSFEAYGYDNKNSGWEYKEVISKRVNNSLPRALKKRKKKLAAINNLFGQNKYFTGRKRVLKEIDMLFSQEEVTAVNICQTISGLGGVGKTQLAVEYCYRYGGNYKDVVWFITADSPMSIYNGFLEFALELKIQLPKEFKVEDLQCVIRKWLVEHEKWLLIFDNLDNYGDIEPYLPNVLNGHFIITTRDTHIDIGFKYSLGVFLETDAIEFLKKRICGHGEIKEYDYQDFTLKAPLLARRLGFLPLALEQAGAYISIVKCSISEYLDLLNEYGLEVFSDDEPSSQPIFYQKVISTTWNISIKNITHEGAKQLFYLCAYMASDNIPVDFFVKLQNKLPSPIRDDLANRLSKNRIVTELRNYSLTSGNAEYICMHQLVQEVVRTDLGNDTRWRDFCYLGIKEYLPDKFENRQQRIKFLEISEHCESILNYIKMEKHDEDYALTVFSLGYGYYVSGSYKKALERHFEALNIRRNISGKNSKEVANSENHIGLAFFYLGNYSEALKHYRHAIDILKKIGNCEEELLEIYNNLALVYRRNAKYTDAINTYFQCLDIKKRLYENENNSIAETYNNIAVAYYWNKEYEQALDWHFKAKRIREQLLPNEHPDLAETYNNIGVVYFELSNYSEAFEYFKKAERIRTEALGKEHPETTMTYDNIASYYAVVGKYDDAITYFKKTLKIRLDRLGENHVDTAATYNNMAYAYRHRNDNADMEIYKIKKQRDDEKAIECYKKALDIFTNNFGNEHPHTQIVIQNLYEMYLCVGDEKNANALIKD